MKVYSEFDLTEYNSYKVRAIGKTVYFPESEEDLISLYKESTEYIVLGSGHNVILCKDYYEKPIIIFNGNFNEIIWDGNVGLQLEAGVMMHDAAAEALNRSLKGLEIFYDIPSSLGGAVVMNAGASGEEIKDVLVKVRYLDLKDLQIKEILKDDISFEYRNSFFQKNTDKIVLKAWLELALSDKVEIKNKMELIKEQRWAKQPKDFPNAGSVFKRPPGYYVGAIMDDLQLKGYKVGGAKISEKHGGFIINFNNAKGEDIVRLINEVNEKVYEKYHFKLEVEQRVIE
ncbi:UDP-N-acetylmuramate dehydrogenase [Sphingobacterium thalpophilum]|uniref:UDP-N-acetylmuramate dehydrogenase n=1 Tax=Sphingobacterium thalpophilum TaxID=259 RepID=UPI0037DA4442